MALAKEAHFSAKDAIIDYKDEDQERFLISI